MMGNIYECKPRQCTTIPWGWVNSSNWVVVPLGEIVMPELSYYFDWDYWTTYPIKELPALGLTRLGTTAMKSVFTTATRFLGMEEALVQLATGELEEGLNEIAEEMLLWNYYLLKRFPFGSIEIGVQGDEIGTSRGMMMSPELYRKYLKPIHKKFVDLFKKEDVPLWYHSDGDISEVLSDIEEIGYAGVYYEDIGQMKLNLRKIGLEGVEVIR